MIRKFSWRPFAYLAILISFLFVLDGCVVQKNPVSGRQRAYGYTWEQEKQIGAEADPAIIAQYGLYDDAELAAYVSRIGEQVLAESHLRRPDTDPEFRNTPFTFRVLDSPVVNAFALPGGYIYVTRGLLAHLENEAQLAVVLGHEVGHVAARHASKRAFQAQLGQLGLVGGAILGQELLGLPGQNILSTGGTLAQLMFLSYGREDERESDELGVEYSALSGYRAELGSAFFESLKRLSVESGSSLPSFLSTHPDPGEREVRIKELAAEWETRTKMNTVNAEGYLQLIDGIVTGEDPRQGFVDESVFYHPVLRFRFPVPQGYTVINQPTQVALVEPKQNAVVVFSIAQGETSAQQAASKFSQQQGLTIVRSSAERTQSGLPAAYVLADAQTQQGQVLRVLAYFIEYGDLIYEFVGYATKQTFGQYEGALSNTMRGFAPETRPEILNVQPTRLNVTRASRTAPFNSFLPSTLPRGFTDEHVAIMNQVALDEQIQAGRQLKLLR